VFVFIDGFWWGLYPWDYYPNYAYGYPYDYDNSYPYDSYNGYPYSYYDSSYPSDYDEQPSYTDSQQFVPNATVSAVQSELAKLRYYNGAIDGTLGDQTEAALARYQEDNDLSVTGTVDAATLQALGIR
jgi:His-Xaa-Ser repeat protein HxsA